MMGCSELVAPYIGMFSTILGMCDVSDVSSILGMCLEIADVISIQYAYIWACHICAHILVASMTIYGDM